MTNDKYQPPDAEVGRYHVWIGRKCYPHLNQVGI